jgi:hypothetical protein
MKSEFIILKLSQQLLFQCTENQIFLLLGNHRPRDIIEDYLFMHLREIGWEGVDWMHLAQDRDQWLALVNIVMNFGVP